MLNCAIYTETMDVFDRPCPFHPPHSAAFSSSLTSKSASWAWLLAPFSSRSVGVHSMADTLFDPRVEMWCEQDKAVGLLLN